MLLSHNLYLITLIGVLVLFTFRAIQYSNLILTNLKHAVRPNILEKLDSPDNNKVLQMADEEYTYWTFFILPVVTLATLCSLFTIVYVNIWGTLHMGIILIFVGIIATALTLSLRVEQFPSWMYHWIMTLNVTQHELNLEYLQSRLKQIKKDLMAVKKGKKTLSTEELNQLKYEGLILSKEAFLITDNLKEAKDVQKLLD